MGLESMIKLCPRCHKNTFRRVNSSNCKIIHLGDSQSGCGQIDFEVWACYNKLCPGYKKEKSRNIPCRCVKRHDTNK